MKQANEKEPRIRFITSDYTDLFRIPDGGTIQVTFPDRQFVEKCKYIDDYHTKIGNSVYHICEYAELLKANGGQCIPEPEVNLNRAAWQLGSREYLMLEHSENGFRYEVLTRDFLSKTQGWLDRPAWSAIQAREFILDTIGLSYRSRTAVSYDMIKQRSKEVLKAVDVINITWKSSQYYPGVRTAEHTLTCDIRGKQFQLTYEVSQHDDGEGFVIRSDGEDIWDIMPEPELRKLEPILAMAVEYGHWKRDIDQANTVEAVRDVRFSLGEMENLIMTKEQIRDLHKMIVHKEAMLVSAEKASKNGKKVVENLRTANSSQAQEGLDYLGIASMVR